MPKTNTQDQTKQSLLYVCKERTLFLGELDNQLEISKAASVLILSIGKPITLIDQHNNNIYSERSFLIPAGMRATIKTKGSVVALGILDFLGEDLAKIIPEMINTIVINQNTILYSKIGNESHAIKMANHIFRINPSAAVAFKQFKALFYTDAINAYTALDERVAKAAAFIRSNNGKGLGIERIAGEVNLSAPRLTQLFKQTTGVSIRRFTLWHRVNMTALRCAQGVAMTEAAIEAGFADYAHFSRTFSEMGGLKPSDMLSSRKNISFKVITDDTANSHNNYEYHL
mgnify:FL=1